MQMVLHATSSLGIAWKASNSPAAHAHRCQQLVNRLYTAVNAFHPSSLSFSAVRRRCSERRYERLQLEWHARWLTACRRLDRF